MAFLGDFGRIFLGGRSSAQVGQDVGGAVGGTFFGPGGAMVGRTVGRDIGTSIGQIGSDPVDVSQQPAGVDSPATLLPISQTGMAMPSMRMGEPQTRNMFIGGFGLPGLLTGAGRVLSKPGVGSALTGLGAGLAADFFINEFGQEKKLVITRKMQRDVKKLFMMSGGDFNMTAELYRMATGRQITPEQVVKIITKTFKNQGPFVTKAAVRKTRSTIRKMETLCDLKDRLCPPKRRAPARRRTMTGQTITQVK